MSFLRRALLAAAVALVAPGVRAQTPAGTAPPVIDTRAGKLTLGAYLEAYYAYNANRPVNRLTSYRGFDDRHDTFMISNIAASLAWEKGPLTAKVALQLGATPDAYARNPSFKYLQEAWLSYELPVGHGLSVQAGVFLPHVGSESIAVKDDWTWSRSNAFYALPIYATGARVRYAMDERWSTTFAIYNGWNSVVDNNGDKSIAWSLLYAVPDAFSLQLMYFGGVERARGAPEGPGWRHLVDAWATWQATPQLAFSAHADAGFEVTRFGHHVWGAGALYGRVRVFEPFYVAARGDVFRESVARGATGASTTLFFPAEWVASATGTLELRPHDNVSFRFEVRHDAAEAPLYFRFDTPADAATARRQTTVLLGAVAWL